jgi:hypothetical protein
MKKGYWSKEDTEKLREFYENNETIDTICKALKRERRSVLNKIYHADLHRKKA